MMRSPREEGDEDGTSVTVGIHKSDGVCLDRDIDGSFVDIVVGVQDIDGAVVMVGREDGCVVMVGADDGHALPNMVVSCSVKFCPYLIIVSL
jgi:hypothetical protein